MISPQRAQSAHSSRGSVNSFLIEHFSSSESSDAGDPPPVLPHSPSEPVPPTVERRDLPSSVRPGPKTVSSVYGRRTWASGLRSKALHALSKQRAKILFTRLVSCTDDSKSETSSKRRREDAAKGLLQMASRGPDGKDIVARKFVKTAAREENGIRALLKLNDDELQPFQSWLWEEPPYPLASTATDLIDLVVSRSTEGKFLRNTLPKVLHDERSGVGAILRLVDKHPEFFVQVDHDLVFRFGTRSVEQAAPLTCIWRRGVKLLLVLLDRLPEAPLETRDSIHLPLLQVLLQACTEGFLWVDENTIRRGKVGSTDAVQLLKYMFRVLQEVRKDVEALDKIIPSRPSLNRLVGDLMVMFAEDRIQSGNTLNITSLLALKSLSILLQSQVVRENVDLGVVGRWAGVFVDIVLQPSSWQLSLGNEPSAGEFAITELKPEKAAFDILCFLPEPAFANALALALSQCDPKNNPLISPPYKIYRVVASLLSLSNTRRHSRKTSVALIQGGTCEYLAQILSCDDPGSRSHRTFWRAKGLAMTCLGNIMERMDREELRRHVAKGVIESAVSIKDDHDTPMVEKGQATFMLQRYNLAAN